jgi:hypothetical protein
MLNQGSKTGREVGETNRGTLRFPGKASVSGSGGVAEFRYFGAVLR